MGFYQSYNFETRSSFWILLQPTENVSRLASDGTTVGDGDFLRLITLFCLSTLENWRWYLNSLDRRLVELVS